MLFFCSYYNDTSCFCGTSFVEKWKENVRGGSRACANTRVTVSRTRTPNGGRIFSRRKCSRCFFLSIGVPFRVKTFRVSETISAEPLVLDRLRKCSVFFNRTTGIRCCFIQSIVALEKKYTVHSPNRQRHRQSVVVSRNACEECCSWWGEKEEEDQEE